MEKIEYETVLGNEQIVFIKVGAGGSLCGYDNKYRRMADRIRERLGATVIRATNPCETHLDTDEEEIRRIIAENGFKSFELYFIGVSDGAYRNLALANRFEESVKLVGINTSYIDACDLEERLNALKGVSKVLIYGTEDCDYAEIAPMLKMRDDVEVKLIEGADHFFSGMVEEFIALGDYL